MGAYSEVVSGEVGVETADLLYATFASVARMNRFPPPEGAERWDAETVQDAAHDFFARDGEVRLRKLALLATDEASFGRLLDRAVRNHLSDIARGTVKGRLSRAITSRLNGIQAAVLIGGSGGSALWALVDASSTDGAPPIETLIAAVYELDELKAARVVSEPRRGLSMISPPTLDAVLLRALEVADCPLDVSTLVEVVVARFPIVLDADELPVDTFDSDGAAEAEDRAAARLAANAVWAQLDSRERLVLPVVAGTLTVREAEVELGMSRSTVHRAAERARVVLGDVLVDEDDLVAVAAELLALSDVAGGGTAATGSASSPHRRGGS